MKLNSSVKNITALNNLTSIDEGNFDCTALDIFQFQYQHSKVYQQYCHTLHIRPSEIIDVKNIPFLPIAFFKSYPIVTTDFEPAVVFESSGTTKTINSKHLVKDIGLYEASFNAAFRLFYGEPVNWCIIALLPSYLERNNSSLVMMADRLIEQSAHPQSGFYLNEPDKLHQTLQQLEKQEQKTLLIGVTFALLDFAFQFLMELQYTIVMETGGMKGRGKELIRHEMHAVLCSKLGIKKVHSEYGMTELLSQAYSKGEGIFYCPPWMKVLIRDEEDPLSVQFSGKGILNIIDLANIHSCSFIATDDAGIVYPDGSFEVLGRVDSSDIRGCSLLTV